MTISIQDYAQWVQSINTTVTTAFSEFVHSMEHVGDQVRSGAITEAQAQNRVANFFYDQYRLYESSARDWAQRAMTTGNQQAASTWNRIADAYGKVAAERAVLGDAAWIKGNAALDLADSMRSLGNSALAKGVPAAGALIEGAQIFEAAARGDWDRVGHVSAGFLGGIGGAEIGVALALAVFGVPASIAAVIGIGVAGAIGGVIGHNLGGAIWDKFLSGLFQNLETTQYRIVWIGDPLALDLDGDGIETVGENGSGSIMFDHDGDGLKTATGWVASDDGFLVLDRNNNGIIDSGQELFGDQTRRSDGTVTPDGFAALADQDTNADGIIDSNDANFGNLRIWRDLNQDGISQANELQTLAQAGVQSLSLTNTQVDQTLSDGNTIHKTGTYTKTDGTTAQLVDLELNENPLYRQFTDTVAIPTTIASLPNLQGSGRLRDLHQAASLSTPLANLLSQYAAATTATAQQALLDDLITAWVDTALPFAPPPPVSGAGTGTTGGTRTTSTVNEIIIYLRRGQALPTILNPVSNLTAEQQQLIDTIEAFSGEELEVGGTLYHWQLNKLTEAYQSLKQSIYESLYLQTRGKPYLDAIGLSLDTAGAIALDFSQMEALFNQRLTNNADAAVADILEFNDLAGNDLRPIGWNGWAYLGDALRATTITPTIQALLDGRQIQFLDATTATYTGSTNAETALGNGLANSMNGGAGNDVMSGGGGDDTLSGDAGNDTLYGDAGNDILYGGNDNDVLEGLDGNDTLYGDAGNDTLDGGAGNDVLDGGDHSDLLQGGAGDDLIGGAYNSADYWGYTWNGSTYVGNTYDGGAGTDTLRGTYYGDTYRFNLGDGADTIVENGPVSYGDTLRFGAGINPLDLVFSRNGNDLIVSRHGSSDSMTIQSWYASTNNQVETLQTATGGSLLNTEVDQLIQAMAQFSTSNGGITWDQAIDQRPNDVSAVLAAYW